MEIIPVIDLLNGQVVRAKRGERHLYRPMESGLCAGSEPLDITQALLGLYPFKTLYIADLDAIRGQGNHRSIVADIRKRYPNLDIWLDAGLSLPGELESWRDLDLSLVIGSENLRTPQQYRQLGPALESPDTLLSLDFSGSNFLGAAEILADAKHWPARAIAMNLAKVGSHEGPDIGLLRQLRLSAGARQLYAAGGIRCIDDLRQLERLGMAGALVASALHDGHLTARQLCT